MTLRTVPIFASCLSHKLNDTCRLTHQVDDVGQLELLRWKRKSNSGNSEHVDTRTTHPVDAVVELELPTRNGKKNWDRCFHRRIRNTLKLRHAPHIVPLIQ